MIITTIGPYDFVLTGEDSGQLIKILDRALSIQRLPGNEDGDRYYRTGEPILHQKVVPAGRLMGEKESQSAAEAFARLVEQTEREHQQLTEDQS